MNNTNNINNDNNIKKMGKTERIMTTFNKQAGFLLEQRNRYIYMLAVFVLLLIVILSDPARFIGKYVGETIVISIVFAMILIIFLRYYSYTFSNQDELNVASGRQAEPKQIFWRLLAVIGGLGISALFIFLIVDKIGVISSKNSIISLIINILIIIAILSLFYRVVDAGGYFSNMPIVRLIVNTLLYIPCLFTGLIDLISMVPSGETIKKTATPTKFVFATKESLITLLLIIALALLYYFLPWFINRGIIQGGDVVQDEPVDIDSKHDLASYEELNGKREDDTENNFDYQYALSFWVYLDARPPSTNPAYTKYATILDYGNKPRVMYNGQTNTMMIVVKEKEKNIRPETLKNSMYEFDDEGNRIIYKKENVLLQKWNNIVLNYSAGTLDVFYNGELVKSTQNVVPYMTYDTLSIGQDNGIKGGVCNVVYYKHPLNINQIDDLYNKLKDKTPPSLYNSKKPILVQMN